MIITGIAHKLSKNKGELMEQNQDGLEYSSEEEGEDLKDTMLSIAKKGRKVRNGGGGRGCGRWTGAGRKEKWEKS